MKTIDKQIALGRQSVVYMEILNVDDHKLKVSIKSDSYEFQSYARISRWNGEKWVNVYSIHFNKMKTTHGLISYSERNEVCNSRHFQEDRDQLIKVAKEII